MDEENSGEVTQTTDQGILNVAAPFWAERGVCVCVYPTDMCLAGRGANAEEGGGARRRV